MHSSTRSRKNGPNNGKALTANTRREVKKNPKNRNNQSWSEKKTAGGIDKENKVDKDSKACQATGVP